MIIEWPHVVLMGAKKNRHVPILASVLLRKKILSVRALHFFFDAVGELLDLLSFFDHVEREDVFV